MVHGVYVRHTKRGQWTLYSIAGTAEAALKDKRASLEDAKRDGKHEAIAGIKSYDTVWLLPEVLSELKEEEDGKQLYN